MSGPPNDETARRAPRNLPSVSFTLTLADGRAIRVDPDSASRIYVGKSSTCDLVIADDAMVSRRHAALEVIDCRLVVTDLDSMNGTYVNDVAVAVAYLEGGETIRLGSTLLEVELVAADPRSAKPRSFGRLIGDSARMQLVYAACARVAAVDVPVVIEGETGTGKELAAECIHEASARAAQPFVVFDATAVTRAALEITLFGEREPGLFELAHGGTLFVDAVDELEMDVQARFLRVIERGEVLRVGETQWRRVDVRVIAATTRNLDKLVEEKRFRDDLLYRLMVARIELPPLRRREGDVEVLARHFFRASRVPDRTDDLLARHAGYDWPGNVRELQNAVTRFHALGDAAGPPSRSRPTSPQDDGTSIRVAVDPTLTYSDARARAIDEFTQAYVERVLAANNGNVTRAAAASGLARRYFQTLRARRR